MLLFAALLRFNYARKFWGNIGRKLTNQYLTVPREVADSYPENVRRLMGYQAHGEFLGVFPNDPDGYWYDA